MTIDSATIERLEEKINLLIEKSSQPPKRWLSVRSAATYSDLSDESIRRLLSSGKLTAHRVVKGRILIDVKELDSIIQTSTKMPRKGRGFQRLAT